MKPLLGTWRPALRGGACWAALWSVAAAAAPNQSVLAPAGVQAERILTLWHITLLVCTAVFVAVLLALLAAIRRATRSARAASGTAAGAAHGDDPHTVAKTPDPGAERRSRRIVAAATCLSVALLCGLVVADFLTDRAVSRLPMADPVRVEMTGHQWWWETRYQADGDRPSFVTANQLRLPVGRPVLITLKSSDVIHTFWVPNLHGKRDMIPGRDAQIMLRADRAGDYRGQCAEFCGAEHALMAFSVSAVPAQDYAAWADHERQDAIRPEDTVARRGMGIFLGDSCAQCHTIRGTPAAGTLGPDLTHLASRPLLAAGTIANNPDNLARWISQPGTMKPATTMPPTQLPPEDLQALVRYLGSLQ
ncbi:cytochrome c oxidase subunit II [Bordetella genomosp. 9]|uniref:cytochrome-c oxidase n=1 Tax=Bordetella genomosp. 9 TaxID=1416803 RepID=A0A261RDR3_9BORD|nr:cytochrome c oxidase subunit II [Bordetella genomosp. 9]OZI23168.1 cytochrome c oxidase subunit II [Bordetella genomosp. 9]